MGRIKDSKKVTLIKDDRLVKKPLSPFIIFYQEQRDTSRSDVANLTQAAAHEWKNLSESAKEVSQYTNGLHLQSFAIQANECE